MSFLKPGIALSVIILASSCTKDKEEIKGYGKINDTIQLESTVGNGGDAVVCLDNEIITSVELLDYVEANGRYDITVDLSGVDSVTDKVDMVLSRLKPYDRELYDILKQEADVFMENTRFWKDAVFLNIDDSEHVAIPSGCELYQIAVQRPPQFPTEKYYLISQQLWDILSDDHKAGLILHEIIYKYAISLNHESSQSTRYLNAYLSSKRFSEQSFSDYKTLIESVNFPFSPPEIILNRLAERTLLSGEKLSYQLKLSRKVDSPILFQFNLEAPNNLLLQGSPEEQANTVLKITLDESNWDQGATFQIQTDATVDSNQDYILTYNLVETEDLGYTNQVGTKAIQTFRVIPRNPVEKTYLHYCIDGSVSQNARHTINVLKSIAKTEDCAETWDKISSLETLDISSNDIADLSPLAGFNSIVHLIANGNIISDLGPLSSLDSLTTLNLNGNRLGDLSPLSSMLNLRSLRLASNRIRDLSPISSLLSLERLILGGNNRLVNIDPLQNLTKLKYLNFKDCDITDISPLASLILLDFLSLEENPRLTDISPLANLPLTGGLVLFTTPIIKEPATCPTGEDVTPLVNEYCSK